jgi:hypothetical protein
MSAFMRRTTAGYPWTMRPTMKNVAFMHSEAGARLRSVILAFGQRFTAAR